MVSSKSLKNMAVKMNSFKANILPISEGKRPDGLWEQWMQKPQSINDVAEFNWDRLKALGVISGVGQWRCFDIDKVTDHEVIKDIVRVLGLPSEYKWIVRSGSGIGYHIHFRSNLEFPAEAVNKRRSNIYFAKCCSDAFDHLELRWSNCQTLIPPSVHTTGNQYEFINGEPSEAPSHVDVGRLVKVFEEFTVIEQASKNVEKESDSDEEIDVSFLPSAVEHLAERLVDYNDWLKCGFALSSLGEKGRKFFLDLSLKNPNYQDNEAEINKKFDSLLRDKSNHVRLNTLFYIAKNYDYKYPEKLNKKLRAKPQRGDFWFEHYDKDKLKLSIDRANFLYFLQAKGYFKMYVGNDYLFIRILNNIVKEVTPTQIKDYVLNYIKKLPEELTERHTARDLYNTLLNGSNIYFSISFLEFLEPRTLSFHRDSINEAYFYFRNCWVKVTKNDYFTFCYDKLDGFIWEKQILQRNFTDIKENIEDYKMSEFQTFLKNVCNNDNDRYYSLKSSVGYLLHTYKDSSVAKAIIFCDEQLSDDANGRSGKSLVGHAISKFRNSVRFDGRNFKQDKNFAFQQVGLDTQVMEFNDVDKKFNFERLFSILTDSISVEKKNKDEFVIPFEKSPKVLISTNYTIQSEGDSSDDRKFEIEFSNHYNKLHKPIDEFGHRFFDEWDESEWNRFDNFMIDCANYYLQKGLRAYAFVNLNTKKLLQNTSKEFIEFMENDVKIGEEYNKKTLMEKFITSFPDYGSLKQHTFTKWIKSYARILDLKLEERKSMNDRLILFVDKTIRTLFDN